MKSHCFEISWLGESQWPPALMLPLLPFISPSLCSQNAPLLFSHYYMHMYMLSDFLSHLNALIHIVYQTAPWTLIFAFLDHFLAIPLLPASSPTSVHPLPLFSRLSTFFLAHPIPLPLPAPLLPFSLFWKIYEHFISFPFYLYMYIYNYQHWKEWILPPFWGVMSCEGRGNGLPISTRPQLQRTSQNPYIYIPSDTYYIHSLWHICSREALWWSAGCQ